MYIYWMYRIECIECTPIDVFQNEGTFSVPLGEIDTAFVNGSARTKTAFYANDKLFVKPDGGASGEAGTYDTSKSRVISAGVVNATFSNFAQPAVFILPNVVRIVGFKSY